MKIIMNQPKRLYLYAYALIRELAAKEAISQNQFLHLDRQLQNIPDAIVNAAWRTYNTRQNSFSGWQLEESSDNFIAAKRSFKKYGKRFLHEYLTRTKNRQYRQLRAEEYKQLKGKNRYD